MLQNVCRVCANEIDSTNAFNLFDRSAHNLLQELEKLTGVLLKPKPNWPDCICDNCQSDLKSAIAFRNRCLQSQRKWEQSPIDVPPSTHIVRVRRSRRRCTSNNDDNEVEVPLSPVEVLIKVEQHSAISEDDDGFDHLDADYKEDAETSISDEEVLSTKQQSKIRRSRALDKSPKPKSKQPRVKATLPIFFCDQCGANITGKSSFDRHLRKHSGVRPFQCELCPARFLSAGELKGHQVMHTGDRNFPCRYCERSYVNYSGRLRHERTHTNERPFVCAQCGKTFTNSYILKNHMLVHSGERLFRCDLCERSFSRPTHLKTHYRSNTHKQNVERSRVTPLEADTIEQPAPAQLTSTLVVEPTTGLAEPQTTVHILIPPSYVYSTN